MILRIGGYLGMPPLLDRRHIKQARLWPSPRRGSDRQGRVKVDGRMVTRKLAPSPPVIQFRFAYRKLPRQGLGLSFFQVRRICRWAFPAAHVLRRLGWLFDVVSAKPAFAAKRVAWCSGKSAYQTIPLW